MIASPSLLRTQNYSGRREVERRQHAALARQSRRCVRVPPPDDVPGPRHARTGAECAPEAHVRSPSSCRASGAKVSSRAREWAAVQRGGLQDGV